jgi:hypothetical protein
MSLHPLPNFAMLATGIPSPRCLGCFEEVKKRRLEREREGGCKVGKVVDVDSEVPPQVTIVEKSEKSVEKEKKKRKYNVYNPNFEGMTLTELIQACRSAGLDHRGPKNELLLRLKEDDFELSNMLKR